MFEGEFDLIGGGKGDKSGIGRLFTQEEAQGGDFSHIGGP